MRPPAFVMLVLFCALAGTGCIPRTLETSPEVQGRVVDEATSMAVGGASVTVVPVDRGSRKPTEGPTTTVTSGPDGRFNVPARSERFWVPALPIDFFGPDATVSVSAPGYQHAQFDYEDLLQPLWKTSPQTMDFTLRLKPSR